MRFGRGRCDCRHFHVDRLTGVVERGRLQDDSGRADDDGNREDPQEQTIEHHCHKLPVFFDLYENGFYNAKPYRTLIWYFTLLLSSSFFV